MVTKKPKRRDDEAKAQQALVEWSQVQPHPYFPGKVGDYLFAIPNGGYKLSMPMAVKFKKMGVKKGVSDLMLPTPNRLYHGLWIEMKKPIELFDCPSNARRAESVDQKSWGEKMKMCGYDYVCCFGWDDARAEILLYLSQGG